MLKMLNASLYPDTRTMLSQTPGEQLINTETTQTRKVFIAARFIKPRQQPRSECKMLIHANDYWKLETSFTEDDLVFTANLTIVND